MYEIRTNGLNEIILHSSIYLSVSLPGGSISLTLSQVHEAGHCVGISPGARLAAVASPSVQFR